MKILCKHYNICPLRQYEKDEKINSLWREKYCLNKFIECKRFQKTEKGIPHSNYMLPDGTVLKTSNR
jgi:hypothetical protein